MSGKSRALVKICLWSALMTWMAFYLGFGLTLASRLASWFTGVAHYAYPSWVVFTFLLTALLIGRYARRKLIP